MHPHPPPLKFRTQQRKTKNNHSSWTDDTIQPRVNHHPFIQNTTNSVLQTDRSDNTIQSYRQNAKNNSSDFIKKLIYENRTIDHNYQRLREQYRSEQAEYTKLQTKFENLKEAYSKLQTAIEQNQHKNKKKEIHAKQGVKSLMRKNTSILMMIVGKEPDSPMKSNSSRKTDEVRNIRHLYKTQKHQNKLLKKKNQKFLQAIEAMRLSKHMNEQRHDYMNNVRRISEQNKDLRNIMKELNDLIQSNKKHLPMQSILQTM